MAKQRSAQKARYCTVQYRTPRRAGAATETCIRASNCFAELLKTTGPKTHRARILSRHNTVPKERQLPSFRRLASARQASLMTKAIYLPSYCHQKSDQLRQWSDEPECIEMAAWYMATIQYTASCLCRDCDMMFYFWCYSTTKRRRGCI